MTLAVVGSIGWSVVGMGMWGEEVETWKEKWVLSTSHVMSHSENLLLRAGR